MFPVRQEDGRLHQKELVYGIVVDGQAKAYTWNLLRDQKNISDVLQNQKLTIQFSPDTEQVLFTNESTKQMIPNLPVYWFSWVAQYPDTLLLD